MYGTRNLEKKNSSFKQINSLQRIFASLIYILRRSLLRSDRYFEEAGLDRFWYFGQRHTNNQIIVVVIGYHMLGLLWYTVIAASFSPMWDNWIKNNVWNCVIKLHIISAWLFLFLGVNHLLSWFEQVKALKKVSERGTLINFGNFTQFIYFQRRNVYLLLFVTINVFKYPPKSFLSPSSISM